MSGHILKIMIKTSDPNDTNYVEFTKNMLQYKGKNTLDMYPHFDPTYVFSSSFKRRIRQKTYDEKAKLFFSEKEFYTQLAKYKIRNAVPAPNQANLNFMFFLETMLCASFPISSYEQSIAYYDENIMNEVTKSDYSLLDFIIPKKSCFSHIKKNNQKYTVIGLTWINDALKHPEYNKIIKYYQTYNTNKSKLVKSEEDSNANLIISIGNLLINIKHDTSTWTETIDESSIISTSGRSEEIRTLRIKMKEIFTDVGAVTVGIPDFSTVDDDFFKNLTFRRLLNIPHDNENFLNFLNQYPAIKKILATMDKKTELEKKIKLQELTFEYIMKNVDDKSNVLNDVNAIIEKIKKLVENTSKDTVQKEIPGVSYKNAFKKKFNEIKQYIEDIEIYSQMNNGSVLQEGILANASKGISQDVSVYNTFSSALRDLNDNKEISNQYWLNEALKYSLNKEDKFKKDENADEDFLFESILKCKEDKKVCNLANVNKYLVLGLEKLKNSKIESKNKKAVSENITETYSVHQAYVYLNVIKGVVDNSNHKLVFCKAADNFFGDYFYREEDITEKEEDTIKNSIFMDLEDKIKEIESKSKTKKKSKSNNRKTRKVI